MADTFGKIKDSFNKGIASIGAKASTSVEKSKLKSIVENGNKEADSMMTELGRKVYSMWNMGNVDVSTLEPQFMGIKAKYEEVEKRTVADWSPDGNFIVGGCSSCTKREGT